MDITVNKKIQNLRTLMKDANIDAFLFTKFDPHQSEYSSAYWNCVKFISGFTGSAGTVVITIDKAVLWTDGRYSLQSKVQLLDTEFEIINTSDFDSIDYITYLYENTPKNGCIAFDERSLNSSQANHLKSAVKNKSISIQSGQDIISELWIDRPKSPDAKVFNLDIKYCGVARKEKIAKVRTEMKKYEATCYIISSLDDIAWLLNLRERTNPTLTFESFAVITQTEAILFADNQKMTDVADELKKDNIYLKNYDCLNDYVNQLLRDKNETVLIAPSRTCYALYKIMEGSNIIEIEQDITTTLKAVKNNVEIENVKAISIRDGVSLVKFIKWIKEAAKTGKITEYTAGEKLTAFRAEEESFICPSFATICGYGPNGAIIHYKANEKTALQIKAEGFLLVDSGGNYLSGTTDITRTIVLGEITEQMRRSYTLVLKSHISLAKVIFLYGSSGHYIDSIARRPLWDNMMDFKHGTGHGIGFALSVHEGPQRIAAMPNHVALEPGMLISNEPGFYVDGHYGIRCENIVLVEEYGESESGNFLCFDTISLCPFENAAIDISLLDGIEIEWINNYHDKIYQKLSPYFNDEEKAWLKEQTRHI